MGDWHTIVFTLILMIPALVNFILSLIQIFNKVDYGYKDYIHIEENDSFYKSCNFTLSDISEIKSFKTFAVNKTIINLLFSFSQFIYSFLRLKNNDKNCLIGVLIYFILMSENICELTLTSIAMYDFLVLPYYGGVGCNLFEKTQDDYKFINNLDIAIIFIISISLFYLLFIGWLKQISKDCDSNDCIESDFFFNWSTIPECMVECYERYIRNCREKCGECCECCRKNRRYDSPIPRNYTNNNIFFEENNNLKNNIRNLKDEIKDLKRQKNIDENNFNTERIKFKEEIKDLKKQKNIDSNNFNIERIKLKDEISIIINKKDEKIKNLEEENSILKQNNNYLGKEIEKLKYSKEIMNNDFEKMENKINHELIKIKQLNVIQFYVNKEMVSRDYNKNNYFQSIFIKEIKEIKNKYELNIDSDKFKEISLYYIKSKLMENLTDLKTKNIFSNPVITQDGKTYEKENINKSNNFIENKLVLEICAILKESGDKLTYENFKNIKNY